VLREYADAEGAERPRRRVAEWAERPRGAGAERLRGIRTRTGRGVDLKSSTPNPFTLFPSIPLNPKL